MFSFLLCAILSQPVIYIALDDYDNSKHLYSELTRDWTQSDCINNDSIDKAKLINEEIKELKTRVLIKFEHPNFLNKYPAYRFSKYQKWNYFNNKAFSTSTFPYKTGLVVLI